MTDITSPWGLGQRDVRRLNRILIVEDNDDLRELLDEVLGDAGYDVLAARDGAEALALSESWRPDAIILDLMMPVMDGPTFLAQRRERSSLKNVPVLVLTAHPYVHRVLDGLGPTAVLRKPYDLDELIEAVAALCNGETGRGWVC